MVKIAAAIHSGVSIVCATCNRYWEGREQGLPEPRCTVQKPCGSPFVRLTFPEYEGPMTDFASWCFVCGARAEKGISVGSNPRVVGMCNRHIPMLTQLEPVGLKLNGEAVAEIVDSKGRRVPLSRYFGTPKKSLIQTITETEAEFAEKTSK